MATPALGLLELSPESSITIYIVEHELAYFVHLCHHSLHWLRLLTRTYFSGPSHSHILSFHIWSSTFMFQVTTLKVPQNVSLANIGQNLFSHNSAAGWARDLFKPSKDAECLLDSILKNWEVWIYVFCGWRHNWGRFRGFWMMSSPIGPRAQTPEAIFCFFQLKDTRQKFASLEHFIGHVAFVVGKLWPKNTILTKIQIVTKLCVTCFNTLIRLYWR